MTATIDSHHVVSQKFNTLGGRPDANKTFYKKYAVSLVSTLAAMFCSRTLPARPRSPSVVQHTSFRVQLLQPVGVSSAEALKVRFALGN